MQVTSNPVQSGFFRDFLPLLANEGRGAFALEISVQLQRLDDAGRQGLWDTWLKRYLDLRLVGLPVAFLSESGLEAFFWRLHSFEKHAFGGHEFALKAMKSDVQGMAVTVEHVAVALGGSETQLIERFKQLWQANQNVLGVLKDNATRPLAVRKDLAVDWPNLKARIDDLRTRPGGEVAADLVMAHRIRGGIHQELPVGDHFELERLFVLLMRVALATFVEVRRRSDESGS
jgi:hypothetical protein